MRRVFNPRMVEHVVHWVELCISHLVEVNGIAARVQKGRKTILKFSTGGRLEPA